MEYIDKWYKEKRARKPHALKRPIEITEEYNVHTGGHIMYGKVTLFAEPNEEFEFSSIVEWPEGSESYEEYILYGVLDTLFTQTMTPILGVSITLRSIGYHEVDSCAIGYYKAARVAVKRIIQPKEFEWNYE